MEKVLFNTVFNRKNKLNSEGQALIQIEAYLRGKKKYFSTKIYVSPEQWNAKRREIKDHQNQISLNKQIKQFRDQLEKIEMDRRNSGKPFDLDFLANSLSGKVYSSFIPFCEGELRRMKIAPGTKENYNATINLLKEFNKDLSFEELTFEFLADFETFISNKGRSTNTVSKHFAVLRRLINLAINLDYMELNKYPFRKFKIQKIKTKREYLTPEELTIIENIKLSGDNEYLQVTLDKYLLACYTGLRFNDIATLKNTALITRDNNEWLSIETQKTKQGVEIPLYKTFGGKGLDIFYKYAGNDPVYLFPDRSNKLENNYLKKLVELSGISKRITFHTSRHTFATLLLYKGVNVTTIQKLLGHSRLETTMVYSKVMFKTIEDEINRAFPEHKQF